MPPKAAKKESTEQLPAADKASGSSAREVFFADDLEEDSDHDETGEMESGNGKSSATQVRKAQNRIAQREFRQRKQQYVRDLEARVDILSMDKEDRTEVMTVLIQRLLKENQELRDMVKTMASFVGEGLGSCLPRLGLSATQLEAILSKADTDTAYEAFLSLRAHLQSSKDHKSTDSPRGPGSLKRKRTPNGSSAPNSASAATAAAGGPSTGVTRSTSDPMASTRKDTPTSGGFTSSYDFLFPDLDAFADMPSSTMDSTSALPPNQALPDPAVPWNFQRNTTPFAQQPTQPPMPYGQMPIQPGMPLMQTTYYTQPFQQSGFGLTVPGNTNLPFPTDNGYYAPPSRPPSEPMGQSMSSTDHDARQRQLRLAVAHLTSQEGKGAMGGNMTADEIEERRKVQEELRQSLQNETLPDSDRKMEAVQLITYHLNNFRANHTYSLPPSLRPTKVQRTVPHEHAIDGLIYPSIRDRMILLRGRYDLVDAFHGMLNEFTIHGTDILDHHNWEISEKWLREFQLLVDDEVYEVTNKWRATRGEPALARLDQPSDLVMPTTWKA